MSDSDVKRFAQELHDYIQSHASDFIGVCSDLTEEMIGDLGIEPPVTGILTGWYLVCEWMADDGRPWLSYSKPPDTSTWRARGLLSEALEDL